MKDRKRQLENLAFYDKAAIEDRAACMAEKGWLVEQPGPYFWKYRRIEPKRLAVNVVYFPKASEFDPSPTEGQIQLEELCKRDGWILAARWGQMQIFYNEQKDPVPIETDPVIQVETVRAAMKKGMLPGQLLLAGLSVMQLMMLGWQLWESPVRFLSRPATAYMIPVWFLVLCAVLCELWGFLAWTRRAEKEAENGRFYGIRGNRRLSLALSLLALFLSGLILCQMGGGPWGLAWLAVVLGGILAMTGAVIYIRERMKKRGASRKKNLFFTIGLTVLMSFCFVAALTVMVSSVGITKRSRPVGTYDKGGWEMDVYDDPIPLEMKDLRDAGCDQWSTMADRAETIFLAHTEYSQKPLTEDRTVPDLRYEVTEVKAGFLYGFLKKRLLWERQDVVADQMVVMADHYEPVDPAPWKALDAYRVYWSGGYLNEYLVFYEDRILEIRFGWEPSKWQMAAAAEKLAGKVEESKK